jgi:hypothetical protein
MNQARATTRRHITAPNASAIASIDVADAAISNQAALRRALLLQLFREGHRRQLCRRY